MRAPFLVLEDDPNRYYTMLDQHSKGNWGSVCAEDAEANKQAARNGDRILSSYLKDFGKEIWIITEADRSATTILLPEEY